ncbi:hypothetical protein SynWH8103_02773 [Synechococcus sp. WH 8103]|nr:hypothetical protein SynWH8103_02773 [Synechococcus sp. WH 8103]
MKTASFTVDWLLSAANGDRFGGPYLILLRFGFNIKKGRPPSAGLAKPSKPPSKQLCSKNCSK